jgi:kinesin family member 6/9
VGQISCRYINNQREDYRFVFNGILEAESKQAEVFERVCRPAADVFLSGINSTIFAYGQTGSGKTFTITGGPERYEGMGHDFLSSRTCSADAKS